MQCMCHIIVYITKTQVYDVAATNGVMHCLKVFFSKEIISVKDVY